jgi:plastocyanin
MFPLVSLPASLRLSLRAFRRARGLALVAVALGFLAAKATPRAASGATRPAATTSTIAIDGTSFQPQTITVKAGSAVVWENTDPFPHTATSTAAGFDSRAIAPGKSWKYTATTKGEFSYDCSFHPNMHATLRVE